MTDVLVVTGGHRVELDALLMMVDTICEERDWRWAHSVQPAAQRWLRPGCPWDAVLLHDIAGLHLRRTERPRPIGPSAETAAALCDLLAAGQGLVVTHHALASWPAWDEWASAIGGRFLYAPGVLRGAAMPSSGTRLARYSARVVAPDHPVCDGVGPLELDDELYLCPVFESEVVPLVRVEVSVDPSLFVRTYEHVVFGEAAAPDCTGHPPGSDLIAWATSAGASPIVYVQPGDSGRTFAVPAYRRLIANALAWVSSDEAHAWARSRGA
jgi:type 1 glutamine amidotransferase